MSTFTYEQSPLPSASTFIRLMVLLPPQEDPNDIEGAARSTSPLHSSISSVPITSLPAFKALSYTWGPPTQNERIDISGHEFSITPSLAIALQHIRHPTKDTILWIDQICINQEDIQEKSEQVDLMSQIYSRAEEVLVWLGPAADGSDLLMDVWDQVGREIQAWGLEDYYTKERFSELHRIVAETDPSDEKTISFHKICKTACWKFDLQAMAAWYRRPWFSRVWVIQEFCLCTRSTVFVCGEKSVQVELVRSARQVYEFSAWYTLGQNRTLEELRVYNTMRAEAMFDPTQSLFGSRARRRNFECYGSTGDSLFQLLQRNYIGTKKEATDSRDKIYGLLALSNDNERLGIKPDYANLQTEQIYTSTARAIIRGGELDLLRLVQFPKWCNSLPSWVPDWRGTIQPCFSTLTLSAIDLPLFSSSGSSKPSLISTYDNSLLGVEGYLVDEIDNVGAPWLVPSEFSQVPYQNYLSQIKFMCMISAARGHTIYEDPQRRCEAFWRIPIGDIEEPPTRVIGRATSSFFNAYQSCLASLEAFQQMKLVLKQEEMDDPLKSNDEDAAMRYRRMMWQMGDKRPFLSKKGYVGMGPVTTNPGDIIVVLIGAQVPFILRPRGQDRFFLLGESYCDGVMDGEIVIRQSKQEFILV
jgi:hypothetical protein